MLKGTRTGLSTSWSIDKSHEGIYTGGKVQVSLDGECMACLCQEDVTFVNATGQVEGTLQTGMEEEEKESIVTFAFRPHHRQIVTASRNLLLRLWDIDTKTVIRTIKAHETPVLDLTFDPSGTLLATAGSDRTVRVFDMDKGYCTHNFRGHTGIVTVVRFHPDPQKLLLVSCSDDASVRVWDLYSQKNIAHFTNHMSPATGVAFAPDGWTMVSCSRDKVLNFYDLRRYTVLKTVPIYEEVEGLCVLPASMGTDLMDVNREEGFLLATAGGKGEIRVWNFVSKGKSTIPTCTCVHTQTLNLSNLPFTGLELNASRNELIAITSEQNLILLDAQFKKIKQIIGYNDQIIALKYVPNRNRDERTECYATEIVAATNSEQIRLMNRTDLSSELLSGHTDIVLAVDVSADGKWLVSVSKDKTARFWDLERQVCVATCVGHTEAVGAVAFSTKENNFSLGAAYFVTGSVDKTIKKWTLSDLKSCYTESGSVDVQPVNVASTKAHDKDVNAISISPNDRIIATAGQDKVIKVWESDSLTLRGVCRGHKRGIWAVVFSPVDQCLASASGDKTVKLWSVKDFACLKTFEGHTASVLNVQFMTAGMQLMSSGADGLIKLWTIKSNECEKTMDGHMDKVWALAATPSSDEMVSGGADSTLRVWKDITAAEEQDLVSQREDTLLHEQKLYNCLQNNEFHTAVQLAFQLNHPRKLYEIIKSMLEGLKHEDKLITFEVEMEELKQIVTRFSDEQLTKVFTWIKEWNTNAKTSTQAQKILGSILRCIPLERLQILPKMKETLDAIIAYSERHFSRLDRLVQKSYLVDYTITSMQRLIPAEATDQDTDNDETLEPIAKRTRVQ